MLKLTQETPCPHCGKRTESIRAFSEKNSANYICTICLKTPTGEKFSREDLQEAIGLLLSSVSIVLLPSNCEGTGSWSPSRKILPVEGGTGWYGC